MVAATTKDLNTLSLNVEAISQQILKLTQKYEFFFFKL